MNESTLWGFQKFLLHLSSQEFVQAFSSLNEVLSLTEANAVNVVLFQEHLNKIGSGGLVAENYHLKSCICKLLPGDLILYQTLLPLLTSFSSASSSASVLLCAATRKNFWKQI